MSYRLYFDIMEYRRRDQVLVDRHAECLKQLALRLPAVAKSRSWATPCRGVANVESYHHEEITIQVYPSSPVDLPIPHDAKVARAKVASPTLPSTATTTTNAEDSRLRSLSSSNGSRPFEGTPKPAPGASNMRPHKHATRSPSPDELAPTSSASSSIAVGQNAKGSRIPPQQPRRKPQPVQRRKRPLSQAPQPSPTPTQQPSPTTLAPRPVSNTKRKLPCDQCRKRKVKCSGDKPECRACKDRGKLCTYQAS